jgi:hypothetical protein
MSRSALTSRVAHLEAQRRPAYVTAFLRRVRACPGPDASIDLLAELITVDQATVLAILDQITDAEWEILVGPEFVRFFDTLPDTEIEALASGNPAATRRVQRAFLHWGNESL